MFVMLEMEQKVHIWAFSEFYILAVVVLTLI